ncbi:MAG: zinc-ribbon domain-containing protein [Candidatus Methanomethylophilaceae archaeon]|nr:zinc-ribbon domain-containing protein [Candidatus Methanomethylophilaceae archaeon]
MYCRNCGAKIEEGTSYCPSCGASQKDGGSAPNNYNGYNNYQQYDSGSFGWAILGFFVPLVGLILWIVWMNDRPKSAKMAGLGALASVIFSVVFSIAMVMIILATGDYSSASSMILSLLG